MSSSLFRFGRPARHSRQTWRASKWLTCSLAIPSGLRCDEDVSLLGPLPTCFFPNEDRRGTEGMIMEQFGIYGCKEQEQNLTLMSLQLAGSRLAYWMREQV